MIYSEFELEKYQEAVEKWKGTNNTVALQYNEMMVDFINNLPVYKVYIYKCKQNGVFSVGYISDDGKKMFTFKFKFIIYSYNDKYGIDSRYRIMKKFFVDMVKDYMEKWLKDAKKDIRLIVEYKN